MSAFKQLRDVSNNFEKDLRLSSTQLFTVKGGEKFEDVVSNKLRDLAIYSSKLKLLRAKAIAVNPEITKSDKENVMNNYEITACWKVLEQVTVKSATQGSAIKKLLTTPTEHLDPEMAEKKEKVIQLLLKFKDRETILRNLNDILKEKESELITVRAEWDTLVGEMKEVKELSRNTETCAGGELYDKLSQVSAKLELSRWLVSAVMVGRGSYDWLADNTGLLAALPLTRRPCNVDTFIQ